MDNMKMARVLSRQRHDFANHLQVIKGYLELGLPERVQDYVDAVVREINMESRLFNSVPPGLTIPFYELLLLIRDKGMNLRIGELNIGGATELLPRGLESLRQQIEGYDVPAGQEGAEISLDLSGNDLELRITLGLLNESGPVVREIVITG